MTLLAPRPDRILTPHTFVVPVVRELPSPSDSLPAAGVFLLLRLVADSSNAVPLRPPRVLLPGAAGSV